MTQESLDRLKEVVAKATPGPWEVAAHKTCRVVWAPNAPNKSSPSSHGKSICNIGIRSHPENCNYIAAFDPPTVSSLLQQIETLQKQVGVAREHFHLIVIQRENFVEDAAKNSIEFAVEALSTLDGMGEK